MGEVLLHKNMLRRNDPLDTLLGRITGLDKNESFLFELMIYLLSTFALFSNISEKSLTKEIKPQLRDFRKVLHKCAHVVGCMVFIMVP